MFIRFDEIPSLPVENIKEKLKCLRQMDEKTDGQLDGQREISIHPTNTVFGVYKIMLFTPLLSMQYCHFLNYCVKVHKREASPIYQICQGRFSLVYGKHTTKHRICINLP